MILMIKLSKLISPSFFEVHKAVKADAYTHYILRGGRGSTKSSFVSLEIVLGIMRNPQSHGIALRQVGNTLVDSVYSQLRWAIDHLGVNNYWHGTTSPLKLIYKPTGQTIVFRGADDATKLKSVKAPFGYFKYIWFEEWSEFNGIEDSRNILQSLMRGGNQFSVFYTFNPPKSKNNWVNHECTFRRADRLIHQSTYLTIPKHWLGEQFFIEAEHLKSVKPLAYEHEYLGIETGTGGDVFDNVKIQKISDSELHTFDNISYGIDFGYTIDPFAFVAMHYDKTRKTLYIFDEVYSHKLSNDKAMELIRPKLISRDHITADSSEPKSINEFRTKGFKIYGAKKGPDSIEYGIKQLQSLECIIIDKERCPHTATEFIGYEYERNKKGEFISRYPDIENHTIDAVRYAMERHFNNNKIKIKHKHKFKGLI